MIMDIKKIIKIKSAVFLPILVVLMAFPLVSYAQNPVDIQGILDRLNEIIDIVYFGIISLIITWIGVMYLLARGEPSKIQTANKALLWGVIGIAVGSLSYIAYQLINYIITGV